MGATPSPRYRLALAFKLANPGFAPAQCHNNWH